MFRSQTIPPAHGETKNKATELFIHAIILKPWVLLFIHAKISKIVSINKYTQWQALQNPVKPDPMESDSLGPEASWKNQVLWGSKIS
jgi:hypothetical protein